jgi:hypothetical protein
MNELTAALAKAEEAWARHISRPEVRRAFDTLDASAADISDLSSAWKLRWLREYAAHEDKNPRQAG